MATTSKQDDDFLAAVVSGSLLEDAIDWIQTNLSPEDVFTVDELERWVKGNLKPDDVFDDKELAKWAEENGYFEQTED